MKRTVLLSLALSVSVVFAEKQPFSRYQSIVDRQMFGPLPPGFDPTKSPSEVQKSSSKSEKQLTKEQEKLQSAIHFSVINVASDGQPEVGFTDNSDPKTPKHYFMKVGESRDGWTVKEADAENATMTIAKDEIEVSLSLGGNSAKDGGTTKAGNAAASAIENGKRHSRLLSDSSMREKRFLRKQREKAAQQERAELEKQEREAERAEQRQQLLAIQEELKKVREQKPAETKGEGEGDGAANNETE